MHTIILLLARKQTQYVIELSQYLNKHNYLTHIIYEDPNLPASFSGLTHVKRGPTAWENAFYYLSKIDMDSFDHIFFIEDDVYCKSFYSMLHAIKYYDNSTYDLICKDFYSQQESRSWHWWIDKEVSHFFYQYRYRSFNPFCRLSNRLIRKIFNYRIKYNKFCFHEILFPSLAASHHFSILDYNLYNNPYIGDIRWEPNYKISLLDHRIYHPVKEHLI